MYTNPIPHIFIFHLANITRATLRPPTVMHIQHNSESNELTSAIYQGKFKSRYNTTLIHKEWHIHLVGYKPFKCEKHPRKFKGGIRCGGHLAITYGGELLYL